MSKTLTSHNPYSVLADIYDQMMSHVDYDEWAEYIETLFVFSKIPTKSIIDISCGTGELLKYLIKSGFKLYATDLSLKMIRALKGKPFSQDLKTFVSHACNLPLKNNICDVVLMLYDSINYLLSEKMIGELYKSVYNILIPGGLFIFDTVTEWHCRTHFFNEVEELFWENKGYQRWSAFDIDSGLQHTEFKIYLAGKIYSERHIQKIFHNDILISLLKENGFEVCAIYENFSHREIKKNSERIHFVCRKK